MLRRGFTLIELLVVISIIAILMAFFFPVFISAKGAVNQMQVSRGLGQTISATNLYLSDHDEVYPLAMYWQGGTIRAWYGHMSDTQGNFNRSEGILSPYINGVLKKDNSLVAAPYLGDENGIGYNWGVIGSDFLLGGDWSHFPNCTNAAISVSLENPSSTIVYATSSYYYATWIPNGDGQRYLFGFFDPLSMWNGNPKMDFRHMGETTVDQANQTVAMTGSAIVAHADGSVKTYKMNEVTEAMFWRSYQEN